MECYFPYVRLPVDNGKIYMYNGKLHKSVNQNKPMLVHVILNK